MSDAPIRNLTTVVLVGALAVGALFAARRRPRATPTPPPVPAHTVESVDSGAVAFEPLPASPLWAQSFYVDVLFSLEKAPKGKLEPAIVAHPGLARFAKLEKPAAAEDPKTSFVVLEGPAEGSLAPMSVEPLRLFGVFSDEASRARYLGTKYVAALQFHGPVDAGFKSLRDVLNGVREVGAKSHALITDDCSRQVFDETTWASRVSAWKDDVPIVQRHIANHVYRYGATFRVVSLGMVKFGLPDIAVEDVPQEQAGRMSELVILVAQALVERGKLDRPGELDLAIDALKVKPDLEFLPGAARKAVIHVAKATPRAGDADNRLVELVFPGPADALHKAQASLLFAIFGKNDKVSTVDDGQEELEAASKRAKGKLLALKPRWLAGHELDHLIVKAPFKTTTGGTEWMWVEVTSWTGARMQGILQNDALYVPGLVVGTRVEVEESAIFDYMLRHPDGTVEGGETNALIEKSGH